MRIIKIGKDKSNDIHKALFDDPGVSRIHCEIFLDDEGNVFLTDKGSTNGTFVNGNKISEPQMLDELDVVLISRPNLDEYENMDKWELIALPTKDIEDPKTPGYCYANVPKKVWFKYVGRAKEVMEEVYESVSNR